MLALSRGPATSPSRWGRPEPRRPHALWRARGEDAQEGPSPTGHQGTGKGRTDPGPARTATMQQTGRNYGKVPPRIRRAGQGRWGGGQGVQRDQKPEGGEEGLRSFQSKPSGSTSDHLSWRKQRVRASAGQEEGQGPFPMDGAEVVTVVGVGGRGSISVSRLLSLKFYAVTC